MKRLAALAALFVLLVSCASPPKDLGDQMAVDNPRMITYLRSLGTSDKGKPVTGVTISDGSNDLQGLVFVDSKVDPARGWRIYLFNEDGSASALAWVEPGGSPLPIPSDGSSESASLLSGDVYTSTEVSPDRTVVILYGATRAWLKSL